MNTTLGPRPALHADMSNPSAAPRTVRRLISAPPRLSQPSTTRRQAMPAESAVKSHLESYFAAFAAHQADGSSAESLAERKAELHEALAAAEAEYVAVRLDEAPVRAVAAYPIDGSRAAAERAGVEALAALRLALANYQAWDEALRRSGGGLYLRPDPIGALTQSITAVEQALSKK
jgi:hypothetical protein